MSDIYRVLDIDFKNIDVFFNIIIPTGNPHKLSRYFFLSLESFKIKMSFKIMKKLFLSSTHLHDDVYDRLLHGGGVYVRPPRDDGACDQPLHDADVYDAPCHRDDGCAQLSPRGCGRGTLCHDARGCA